MSLKDRATRVFCFEIDRVARSNAAIGERWAQFGSDIRRQYYLNQAYMDELKNLMLFS
jgi:hypothetical protein